MRAMIVAVVAFLFALPAMAQHPHCDLGKPVELSLLDPDFPTENRFKNVVMSVNPRSCRARLSDADGGVLYFTDVFAMIRFVEGAVSTQFGGLYVVQRQCLSNYSSSLHADLDGALIATLFNFKECVVRADRR
jgi:hypothetical protein